MSKDCWCKPTVINPCKEDFPPTINELEKRSVLSSVQVSVYTSVLLGKILTLLDASIPDEKQNKAVKDLVKTLTWSTNDILKKWCWGQGDGNGSTFPFHSGTPNDMLV